MLNRRILRIKAFKVMYEYAVRGGMNLEEAQKTLDRSCEATRDLYLYMLAIISPLTREAGYRNEVAKGKFNPTEEELNPNEKFASNALATLFDNDPDFQKIISRKKLSWDQYDIFIRSVLDSMKSKDYFIRYMESPDVSLSADCKLFTKVFEEEFVDSDQLAAILEDISPYWIDDLAYALSWCCRTMDCIASGKPWRMPELYQSEEIRRSRPDSSMDSDRDFVRKLLRCAFNGYDKYFGQITNAVPDWDKDRLFSTDIAIITLGLAEADNFPEIPTRVTLNEWIEISKFYCAPGSHQFINGLMDKLIREHNNSNN